MSSIKKTAERLAAKRGQDEGFTLIELLVVIVILGVLAAVVVFSVGGITDTGQTASRARRIGRPSRLRSKHSALRATPTRYPGGDAALVTAGFFRDAVRLA